MNVTLYLNSCSNCSMNSSRWYDVTCNTPFNPPRAFLHTTNIEIREILNSGMRIANVMDRKCHTRTGDSNDSSTVVGCDDRAFNYHGVVI